jgi:hypothetical protein
MNKLEEYVLRYQGIHHGTDQFLALDGKLHSNEQDPSNGKVLFDGSQLGKKFPTYIQHFINSKNRAVTLLDYGCGKAIHTYIPLPIHGNKTLLGRFNGMIQCYYSYDPAVKHYSIKPPSGMVFDVTCCADVMEHIPEEFVPEILTEIGNYTKDDGAMIFSISGNPAKKMFKDGENLHATIKSLEWWIEAIQKYCGDKSFVLIYNDDSKMIPATGAPPKVDNKGVVKQTICNTLIRYYNSPALNIWEQSFVQNAYYASCNVEEVK